MTATQSGRLCVFVVALGLVLASTGYAAGNVRELEWDDLIPKDWDPFAKLESLLERSGGTIEDGSPEADALLREFVNAGRSAPVVGELDGQTVKLPGYVVPLDFEDQEIKEFLLVPYFGACIHVPPPPANQIVYVKTREPYSLTQISIPVWVTGVLKTQSFYNDVGDAGYTMEAKLIEPYQ